MRWRGTFCGGRDERVAGLVMNVEGLVERVDRVAPRLEAGAVAAERLGALPAATIDAFREAELLAFKVPTELGGFGAGPLAEARVLEAAACADGSTGWVLGILAVTSGIAGAFLPAVGVERLFGDGIPLAAGAVAAKGLATPSGDGFRLSGRWSFGSGIRHADWVLAGAMVEGEAPPAALRMVLVPSGDVEIHDNWQVAGLRGTGSCDYSMDDVFVPAEQTFGLLDLMLGKTARGASAFSLGLPALVAPFHIGVALGIAKRALAEVSEQAANKARGFVPSALVENPTFQDKVGRAALELDAARTLALSVLTEVQAAAEACSPPAPPLQAKTRAVACYVTEVAQRVATAAFHAAGGGALFDTNPLQRCFRDAHAAGQHFAVSDSAYRAHGQFLLGVPGANPML